jgi:uncharacterized protein (TIGR02466 family)
MGQDFDKIKAVSLWPTTVYVSDYQVYDDSMLDEINRLSTIPNTIKKSNSGGWQSEADLYRNSVFKPLCQHISTICFKVFGKDCTTIHQMWAGINKKYDHNVIHNHGAQYNISGVYYLEVPKDSGNIVFRDPRSVATLIADRTLFGMSECETFIPYNGLLLLFPSFLDHYVTPNNSESDRISISFDLTLRD